MGRAVASAPVRKVARRLPGHRENVLTCFDHRLSHAARAGLNSKIQAIKHNACGDRNREHVRIAIFFRCGGLDLLPRTHKKGG